MANCHKIFLKYNNHIALDSKHKGSLRISRNAVRKKILSYFIRKNNGFLPKFHGQGSFMMNTIIEPLDREFDVDDGIYFHVDERPSQAVGTFHNWITEALEGHTKQPPVDKQTCVRLIYAGEYHLDLPIYYIINQQSPYLAHKGKGWIESDPREFIKWFNEKADEKGQLKRVVRYLKSWSDYRKGQLPSGLILSILVARNIFFDEQDDIALYETLKNIKSDLDFEFVCQRPTSPIGEDLLEKYSKTNKEYFLTQIASFINSAEKALSDDTSEVEACKSWQRHFGKDRFPCGSSNSSRSENDQNISDVITFTDNEEFIEDLYPVDIQYNLQIDCKVTQDGFMTRFLRDIIRRKLPLLPGKSLEFYVDDCDVPKPYTVMWKVCNVGDEARKRNQIRGEIFDTGSSRIVENSNFNGPHFVECYVIKKSFCVARSRIEVAIRNQN